MSSRLTITVFSILVGILSYSQDMDVVLQQDTTYLTDESSYSSAISPLLNNIPLPNSYIRDYELNENLFGKMSIVPHNFFDKDAVLPRLGNLGGYVTRRSLPGLMGIESGSLSYNFNEAGLSFTPEFYVDKYAYFRGMTTSIGFGGKLNFAINEKFSITAFGSYHTNSHVAHPAVISNMSSSRFGGYATWNINDKWGLNVGAQRVYNSAQNRWQTVPIVMPTFKINGKDVVGVDVGGLLYQIVDWNRNKNGYVHSNPTAGPPVRPVFIIPPRE